MNATNMTAAELIERSVSYEDTSDAPHSSALEADLDEECDDATASADSIEYRGVELDGSEWTVVLTRGLGDAPLDQR